MDWREGEFFDDSGLYLKCATVLYTPDNGRRIRSTLQRLCVAWLWRSTPGRSFLWNKGIGMAEPENWERQTLEKLLFATLQEQRSARRWSIFFRSLGMLLVLLFLIAAFMGKGDGSIGGKHTALVDLQGVIAPGGDASADSVILG
ncbi:MAG: hypothetical protein ACREUA_05685, partial [Burkholderiales bacterium]